MSGSVASTWDAKPANILLEADHTVLADFGVAKAAADVDRTQLTRVERGEALTRSAALSAAQ
jgi:serine/threonine protein kinase